MSLPLRIVFGSSDRSSRPQERVFHFRHDNTVLQAIELILSRSPGLGLKSSDYALFFPAKTHQDSGDNTGDYADSGVGAHKVYWDDDVSSGKAFLQDDFELSFYNLAAQQRLELRSRPKPVSVTLTRTLFVDFDATPASIMKKISNVFGLPNSLDSEEYICQVENYGVDTEGEFGGEVNPPEFGWAYNTMRGACRDQLCDCELYQPPSLDHGDAGCMNCGHFPTVHYNMGKFDAVKELQSDEPLSVQEVPHGSTLVLKRRPPARVATRKWKIRLDNARAKAEIEERRKVFGVPLTALVNQQEKEMDRMDQSPLRVRESPTKPGVSPPKLASSPSGGFDSPASKQQAKQVHRPFVPVSSMGKSRLSSTRERRASLDPSEILLSKSRSAAESPVYPPEGKMVQSGSMNEDIHIKPLKVENREHVPFVVQACIDYLEKHVETEGIFRKSGSVNLINVLKRRFDIGGCQVDIKSVRDVHSVAGLLKLFFRDLPDPLLTYDLFQRFIVAQTIEVPATRIKYLGSLIAILPTANRETLKVLIQFLARVASHSNQNLMDISNLALVFGPNILRSKGGLDLEFMYYTPQVARTVAMIINNHKDVFAIADKDEALICRVIESNKEHGQLALREDDVVFVFNRVSELVWQGEIGGRVGTFPSKCVMPLEEGDDLSTPAEQLRFRSECKNTEPKGAVTADLVSGTSETVTIDESSAESHVSLL